MHSPLIADLSGIPSQLPSVQVFCTMAAGLVAGLSVVGVLHYLIRPRVGMATHKNATPETADPFVHGSAYEQRKSIRREGNPVEVLLYDPTACVALSNGFVVDRSVGGLGLMTHESLLLERRLNIRPVNATPLTPWVELIVKSSRPTDHGFELGCQFVRTPPWAVLLMFG